MPRAYNISNYTILYTHFGWICGSVGIFEGGGGTGGRDRVVVAAVVVDLVLVGRRLVGVDSVVHDHAGFCFRQRRVRNVRVSVRTIVIQIVIRVLPRQRLS